MYFKKFAFALFFHLVCPLELFAKEVHLATVDWPPYFGELKNTFTQTPL